ncbi:hypothetical protein [Bradyrhizobium sp. 5.13L]
MTAFITARTRLPAPSARKAARRPQFHVQFLAESTRFMPESSRLATVPGVPSWLPLPSRHVRLRFHDRGAGRLWHDHHAVIIRADDVARLDGNPPTTIG